MRNIIFILFLGVFINCYSQDSTLVITTNDKCDTLHFEAIKGVVYKNQYFIQGDVISKDSGRVTLDARFLNQSKNIADTIISIAFEEISAIVYKRPLRKRWSKAVFTKSTTSKISRFTLMGFSATAIILTQTEDPTAKNYILPIIVIPITLVYHAIVEYDIFETKKLKLKKGISAIR